MWQAFAKAIPAQKCGPCPLDLRVRQRSESPAAECISQGSFIIKGDMSLANELQKVGLSDKEAKVYLATLELAQETAPAIAKKAEINRTTAYVVLDSLIAKGLASSFQQDSKTRYTAEDPETLIRLFALQKRKVEERQDAFERAAPELRAIFGKAKSAPVVRFFEGKDGLKEMFEDYVRSGTGSTYIIFSMDDIQKVFTREERKRMAERRIREDIRAKIFYTYEKEEDAPTFVSKAHGERVRISGKDYPISCDIALYDGKVRIVSLGKRLCGVIIEDREIYKTLSGMLQLAWEGAKS